jgi:hypothetical protein
MEDATAKDNRPKAESRHVSAFVVGMPRAATRWLCKCLNEHHDIAAFGESLYWGRRYVEPQPDGRYSPEQLRRVIDRLRDGFCVTRYSNNDPGALRVIRDTTFSDLLDSLFPDPNERPTPAEVFLRITGAIGNAEDAKVVVEKTPHHLNWIDRIVSAIPDAKFIIMLREPYSFMLSYKHQGDRRVERVRRSFERRYHPIGAALVWRGCMIAALAARKRLPEQTHDVPHDELRDSPGTVLDSVQQFLGVEVPLLVGRVPQDTLLFSGAPRPELSAADIFWMNRIAGRTMREAGYAMRPTPRHPWPIIKSILILPVWAIRNIITMKRITDGSILAYFWRWIRPAPMNAANNMRAADRSHPTADSR